MPKIGEIIKDANGKKPNSKQQTNTLSSPMIHRPFSMMNSSNRSPHFLHFS